MTEANRSRPWPVADWVRGYRPDRLGKDSVGALTAWALIVPECVAYAQIAGVSPVVVLDLSASFRLGLPVLDTLDELRRELDRRGVGL
jgi:MFS superfamily sulfate permease-like transporter